jgi:hypothetical protein
MPKVVCAAVASVFMFTAIAQNTASATVPVPVPVLHPLPVGSSAAGAAAVGGFLGVVALLDGYDLIRRTTCSGDFLGLGGPGFTEPMPNGNVMIPQCPLLHKGKHKKH